ncbi:RNA polymerase sigma factor SigJ [Paenibacillus sp. FSL K6-3182]|uniref:RNA polymerase sigma factor SigJ n=1 Tax=unclassified Paenibacillus TaxID=185978 RepID=UPI0030CB10DA
MKELYLQYKALLFKIAYQLTGSAADAEDIVQDVFVKAYDIDPESIAEPKAYLCKMATNRSLDLLKSARKQRERYVGPWLPEPIITEETDALDAVIHHDLLSYAMLVLLERLTPSERAVFVLREALGFDYSDIAKLIEKSEVNCRKLLSRARDKMGISEAEPVHAQPAGEEWVRRFVLELAEGNVKEVLSLLAEEVVLLSDGGGKVSAAIHPIKTRENVSRFLFGLVQKGPLADGSVKAELRILNGQTGLVLRSDKGIEGVTLFHVVQGGALHLYIVRNPDKLKLLKLYTGGSS